MKIEFQKSGKVDCYVLRYSTIFEARHSTRGTHIPTDKPRNYIGMCGEILIDDDVPRDQPYAKIGDGQTSFDELSYIEVVKDYYGTL